MYSARAAEIPRSGTNFIATEVFSEEDDAKILKAFEGLRVADVTDGMDSVGLQNVGLMDPEIHPLWRDAKEFKHRFIGIAVTVRYVPTQRPAAGKMPNAEFDKWVGNWYSTLSPEPFGLARCTKDELRGGDAAYNAQALRDVLEGKAGAFRDTVLMNAGAGLVVAGKVDRIEDGMELAAASIDQGKAAATLERLVKASNR